jgi:hypothetical protein
LVFLFFFDVEAGASPDKFCSLPSFDLSCLVLFFVATPSFIFLAAAGVCHGLSRAARFGGCPLLWKPASMPRRTVSVSLPIGY